MAELLVRVIDKVHADVYMNCSQTKRGDVIDALEDGWAWGPLQTTPPEYRLLAIPGLPLDVAKGLCVAEADARPHQKSRMLQGRQFRLDLAHASWPDGFQAWLSDDTRTVPIYAVTFADPIAAVAAVTVKKPPIPDPAIIGDSR